MKIILLFSFFCLRLFAGDTDPFAFEVNAIGVFQGSGNNVYSGEVGWAPRLDIGAGFKIRGELAVGLLKNMFGDRYFETHYQAFAEYELSEIIGIEAGAGFETWIGNGGTHPVLSGNIVVPLPILISSVFGGFSYFYLPGAPAREVKIGIMLSF